MPRAGTKEARPVAVGNGNIISLTTLLCVQRPLLSHPFHPTTNCCSGRDFTVPDRVFNLAELISKIFEVACYLSQEKSYDHETIGKGFLLRVNKILRRHQIRSSRHRSAHRAFKSCDPSAALRTMRMRARHLSELPVVRESY